MLNENENITQDIQIERVPKKIIASFQLGSLIGLLMSQLYALQLSYYYLGVVGLDVTLFLIAMIIYTIFNMFNDPLLGYLCDKSKKLTSKWGKRFPFIIMGGIPYCFMIIFIFMAPRVSQVGQFGVFFWILFFLCLSDLVFSLYSINRGALFPDKFRDNEDRVIAGYIGLMFETVGVVLGILIPVVIVVLYGETGWTMQAIILSIIAFVVFILMIPGVREDEQMKERRSRLDQEEEHEPFFEGMKDVLKNKNYVSQMVFNICYGSAMGVVMASIPFFIHDVLQMSKMAELLVLVYVVFIFISVPIWFKIAEKIGIKKVALIGANLLCLMLILLLFVPIGPSGLPLAIVILIMGGFVDGALVAMFPPLGAAAIDEMVLESGKRQEGLYGGVGMFFGRIGILYPALTFWIVMTFWGYQLGTTDPSELMGLRIQLSVFPLIIMVFAIIIFWKYYSITPEQIKANARKLKEMGI